MHCAVYRNQKSAFNFQPENWPTMDDSPPDGKAIVRPHVARQQLVVFYWVRERGRYAALEVRDVENSQTLFRADLHPRVHACGPGGRKSGNRLPLEDHDVLREETRAGAGVVGVVFVNEVPQVKVDMESADSSSQRSLTLSMIENFLGVKVNFGPDFIDQHRIQVRHFNNKSTSASTIVQAQSQSQENHPLELEIVLSKLEEACRWNEDGLKQVEVLRSYLTVKFLRYCKFSFNFVSFS